MAICFLYCFQVLLLRKGQLGWQLKRRQRGHFSGFHYFRCTQAHIIWKNTLASLETQIISTDCLLRLPMYYELTPKQIDTIVAI
jgi:hypothetical protein